MFDELILHTQDAKMIIIHGEVSFSKESKLIDVARMASKYGCYLKWCRRLGRVYVTDLPPELPCHHDE